MVEKVRVCWCVCPSGAVSTSVTTTVFLWTSMPAHRADTTCMLPLLRLSAPHTQGARAAEGRGGGRKRHVFSACSQPASPRADGDSQGSWTHPRSTSLPGTTAPVRWRPMLHDPPPCRYAISIRWAVAIGGMGTSSASDAGSARAFLVRLLRGALRDVASLRVLPAAPRDALAVCCLRSWQAALHAARHLHAVPHAGQNAGVAP